MPPRIELYQKVVPLVNLGVWERNLITGEMYWNEIVREIYEVPADFNPTVFESLSYYLEPHRLSNMIEDVINTRTGRQGTLRLETAKGNFKWVKVHVRATFEEDICRAIYGTIEDITEQKDLYNMVEEKDQRFYQAFDHAPIGMAMLSIDGDWLKVNTSLCASLQYEPADFQNFSLTDIIHSQDLPSLLRLSAKLKNGNSDAFNLEMRLYNKAGDPVWVMFSQSVVRDAQGEPLYFITHIRDISERRKYTEILLKERKKLDNIIKSTGVGTWEWDISSDEVMYNQRAAEILGFDKNYLDRDFMKDWQRLIHPEDQEINKTALRECFKRDKNVYHCECRMRHRSGLWIWVELHGKVINWSPERQALLMLGTISDIHERKTLEYQQTEALKIINNQNQRLLDFAHIVSHNLRSHTGNLQMLVDELMIEQNPNEIRTMVGMLGSDVGKLQESLANLNEVIKVQRNQEVGLSRLNLLKETQQVLEAMAGPIAAAGASVILEVDPELYIQFNAHYLKNILSNLVSNCLKYRNPAHQLQLVISSKETETLNLRISDNGLGIDLKKQGHKLFGMYKTFHGNPDARGIGLFLVRNQMEALGGSIYAESEVMEGSTFILEFPRPD